MKSLDIVANSRSGPSQLVHCTGLTSWCCRTVLGGDIGYNSSCCDSSNADTTNVDFEAFVRVPVTNIPLGNIHDNITTQVNTTSNSTTLSCPSSNSSSLTANSTTTMTARVSCGHDKAVGVGIGAGSVAGLVLLISVIAAICVRVPLREKIKKHPQAPAYNYFHKTDPYVQQPHPPSPPSHYQSTHPLMELSVTNNVSVYEIGTDRSEPHELHSARP